MAKQPKDGGITWTNETWNPIRGCTRVSEGCRNCYAERMAARFSGPGQPYEGLAEIHDITKTTPEGKKYLAGDPRWTGKIKVVVDRIHDPIRWKRPRMVFVNSMSDLFHEGVTDETIDRIFTSMALAPKHIFQVLTKRPERMQKYMERLSKSINPLEKIAREMGHTFLFQNLPLLAWPIRNVWLGVSVEDQESADYRIPLLLQTQAEIRWVSYEPALGPVDFTNLRAGTVDALSGRDFENLGVDRTPGLNWIVVGGESGPGARRFDVDWARNTVKQCKAAGVSCFVKQFGANSGEERDTKGDWHPWLLQDSHGADMAEWPEDLRVRDFPKPLALSA